MFCVILLLSTISITTSDTTVTIPTPQLFTNTLKRWGVEIGDRRDLGERWARFVAAVDGVHQTTSGVLLTSLNKFTVMNDVEYNEIAVPLFEGSRINMTLYDDTRAPFHSSRKKRYSPPATYTYWEDEVGLNPPRDQWGCGSCWSFPTVGALEAVTKQLTGDDVSYSEQYFVDCAFDYNGCSGGDANDGFKVTEAKQYLISPEKLPYTGIYTKCKYTADDIDTFKDNAMDKIWLQNWYPITATEDGFFEALTYSPISFGTYISSALAPYSGGVFEDTGCSSNPKPHAMLIVGYTQNVIRVKASYGTDWGDKGYVNYKRGSPYLTSCKFFDRGFFIQATYRRELQYAYCNDKKSSTRKECKDSCSAMNKAGENGWTLAVIPTKYHNEVARQMVEADYPGVKNSDKFNYVWIGLKETDEDGSYAWEDPFTPFIYASFAAAGNNNKWGLMNKNTGDWTTKSSTTFTARGLCSRPRTCRDIRSSIPGGSVIYSPDEDEVTEGTTATVSCDPGLKVTGEDSLTCVGGRWDADLPTCTSTSGTCTYNGEGGSSSTHTPDKSSFSAGEEVQVRCIEDDTTTQHTCTDGTFIPAITQCQTGGLCAIIQDDRVTVVPSVTALLQDQTVTVTCVTDEAVTVTLTCDRGALKPSFNVDDQCGGGVKLTLSFILGGLSLFVILSRPN